jgi:hypothetical protein
MRGALAIVVLLLAGCHGEPSFDERYDSAEKTIREKAADIDAELARRERLASEAAAPSTATADKEVRPRR